MRQFSLLALDLFARDDVRWLEKRLAARREAMPLAEPVLVAEGEAAPRYAFGRGGPTVHTGAATQPPRIAPARGPPLWAAAAAAPPAGNDPHWELASQPLPEIEFDQRLT